MKKSIKSLSNVNKYNSLNIIDVNGKINKPNEGWFDGSVKQLILR